MSVTKDQLRVHEPPHSVADQMRSVSPDEFEGLAREWAVENGWVMPELVSAQEIADRLGVRKPTVHMWRARGILPEPDYDLAVGPVWLWGTIREWAESTGRLRPGQHRHPTTPSTDQQDSP